MCRLFGLTAGTARVHATFWLLDAPDSLQAQSHRNADGSGIGFFDPDGVPVVDKQPEPAFSDQEFTHRAREAESSTFVAHVRLASAGGRTVHNTHPFTMGGRLMAHNGGFGELPRLDERLGSYADLVQGDTDSERYFALITQQTDAHGGDVAAGIAAAAGWIAANLPVAALNTIVTAPGELWALRYPDQHALHILQRPADAGPDRPADAGPDRPADAGPDRPADAGPDRPADAGLHVRSATSSMHVPGLADAPAVVIASEELDGEDGWRMLSPGELVHVGPDLRVRSRIVLPNPPTRLIPLTHNPNIDI